MALTQHWLLNWAAPVIVVLAAELLNTKPVEHVSVVALPNGSAQVPSIVTVLLAALFVLLVSTRGSWIELVWLPASTPRTRYVYTLHATAKKCRSTVVTPPLSRSLVCGKKRRWVCYCLIMLTEK